MAQSRV
jgi:hypothetical protein